MNRKWYAVIVQPHQDTRFACDLGERGYDSHIAMTFRKERYGRRFVIEPKLLYSPYVWVCVDEARREVGTDRPQNFHTVKQTYGYADVVSLSGDGKATEIPERVVLGMRRDQNQDFHECLRRVRRKESVWKIGDTVKPIEGHDLAGYEGTVTKVVTGAVWAEFGPAKLPWRLNDDEIVPARQWAKSA